jgi:hypothetical protein
MLARASLSWREFIRLWHLSVNANCCTLLFYINIGFQTVTVTGGQAKSFQAHVRVYPRS